jgi:hypothetical protein
VFSQMANPEKQHLAKPRSQFDRYSNACHCGHNDAYGP